MMGTDEYFDKMMNPPVPAADYTEFKRQLDTELSKSVESFVRIGYLLRLARDTDILQESGYANVNEFAEAEYNLEKTAVSRFISINERFTLPEDHTQLREQFRGIGHAKLALMLTLPDEINEEISANWSKQEIKEVKAEYDAEQKVSDVEVWLEGEKPEQAVLETAIEKAVHEIGRQDRELFREIFRTILEAGAYWDRDLRELLAPDGEAMHSVRIQGMGRLMIFVKDTDRPVTIVNARTNEKEERSWEELREACRKAFGIREGITWEDAYAAAYGISAEAIAEKEEVAPAQQKPAPAQQKKSKVIKHTEEKNVAQQNTGGNAGGNRQDEQGEAEGDGGNQEGAPASIDAAPDEAGTGDQGEAADERTEGDGRSGADCGDAAAEPEGTQEGSKGGEEAQDQGDEAQGKGDAYDEAGAGEQTVEQEDAEDMDPEISRRWNDIEKSLRDIMEDIALPVRKRHPDWIAGLLGLIQMDLDEIRKM